MQEVRFNDIEFKWALDQLMASNLVRVRNDGNISLSDAGVDHCWELEHRLGPQNAILLTFYYQAILSTLDEEEVSP